MKHSVYLITCKDGRQYCGYTSRSPQTRLSEHLDTARKGKVKTKLYSILRSHGLKSFEVLGTFEEEAEALIFEIQYIADNDLRNVGCNTSLGGEGRTLMVEPVITAGGLTYKIEQRKSTKRKRKRGKAWSRKKRRR